MHATLTATFPDHPVHAVPAQDTVANLQTAHARLLEDTTHVNLAARHPTWLTMAYSLHNKHQPFHHHQ